MSANLAALNEGFNFHADGRSGAILYKSRERILELYWEMSGVPEYDILLWLDDSRYWTHPKKEPIEETEHARIIAALGPWLAKNRIRSDLFPPEKPQVI